jgi:hypothetical protein
MRNMSKRVNGITRSSCIICMTDYDQDTPRIVIHETKRQVHSACVECIDMYLSEKLNIMLLNGTYKSNCILSCKFVCPGNPNGLQKNQCKHTFFICCSDKYTNRCPKTAENIQKICQLDTSDYLHLCSNKSCRKVVKETPFYMVDCPDCHTTKCVLCNVEPFHLGMSCEQHKKNDMTVDKELEELLRSNVIRFCPSCNHAIEKTNDTCNKVYCSECHTKFCWLCGEAHIDYDHFRIGNPNKCAGKLFEGIVPPEAEDDGIFIFDH